MLIVLIEEARPGMKLAVDIGHPDNPEHELLRAGFILDDGHSKSADAGHSPAGA